MLAVCCGLTYRAVLHHQPLVRHHQLLQGVDDAPQVRLVFVVIELPLGVQNVVHGHQVVLRNHGKFRGTTPS